MPTTKTEPTYTPTITVRVPAWVIAEARERGGLGDKPNRSDVIRHALYLMAGRDPSTARADLKPSGHAVGTKLGPYKKRQRPTRESAAA